MTARRVGWSLLFLAALPVGGAVGQLAQEPAEQSPAVAAESGDATAAEVGRLVVDPANGPMRLEVSLDERKLRVIQADSVLKSYPVAIGKAAHPTPRGKFGIRRVIWNPRWVPPNVGWARGKKARGPGDPNNPMGRVKLFFQEPDYYVHGTNNEESLGEAASHGCVRMANDDIVELARVVMENGGESRPPAWYTRVLNYVRSTSEVRLSEPVTLTVVR